jgi:acyl-CoA-binding protein
VFQAAPGMFQFKEKAKHSGKLIFSAIKPFRLLSILFWIKAWKSKAGLSKEQAQQDYISKVKGLISAAQ